MNVDPTPPDMQPAAPHSWTQAWIVALTQPNEQSYSALADDPSASVGKAFAWVFVSGLVSFGVASLLRLAFISTTLSTMEQARDASLGLGVITIAALVCLAPLSAAMTGIFLMASAGIQQFVAGALGGEGSFSRLYYVVAAYTAPISLIGTVLSVIPFLGACLSAILGFYALALNALAIKAVNRFGWGSAVLSMLVPVVFLVLIFIIVFFGLLYPSLTDLLAQPSG
jgi:hypothetical protein